MAGQIYVPENAPFSPEQREWLNQFFAQHLAGAAAAEAAAGVAVAAPVRAT